MLATCCFVNDNSSLCIPVVEAGLDLSRSIDHTLRGNLTSFLDEGKM